MQSYTIKYILEQASSQLDAKTVFTKLKEWINEYNRLSPEDQEKLADETYGATFHKTVPKVLEDLINTEGYSPESQEYINANKENIVKDINEFKEIVNQYPDIASKYSNYLDKLEIHPAYDMPSGDTATAGGAPSSDNAQKETYATDYTGPSIVDFLEKSGKPSDFESRKQLAAKLGIQNYTGTADQNTQMLNTLRGTSGQSSLRQIGVSGASGGEQPIPTFKFGDMEFPPYVDMGGGRYVKATPEQIADPNLQLYIQNPNKGAGEYGKPNFVKMRREKKGGEIRPQSQFGGVLGSLSNLGGDIGRTLSKPLR